MQALINYATNLTATEIASFGQTYWIIPVGMLALYFYGIFHFNTPDYRLSATQSSEVPPLLTMAPPKFTTTRGRFRRYAILYVFILEAAFITFVFFTDVYMTIAGLLNIATTSVPIDGATLQYKALVALFFLTGLLPSFPLCKDVDAWLLRQLHQAALIPDDARLLASRLFNASFKPSTAIRTAVRQALQSRDTVRFADGEIHGRLEQRVISLLWLQSQLKQRSMESGCEYFAVRFDPDLVDMTRTAARLKPELISYFREQAKLVPENVVDIDQYLIDRAENEDIERLVEKRKPLLEECDALYLRLCLLTSVLAYSAESKADDIGALLSRLGFAIKIHSNPILDWMAAFRVVGIVFMLTFAMNLLFSGIANYFHQYDLTNRPTMAAFTLVTTATYFIVIFASMKLKRRWRKVMATPPETENLKLALYCYIFTVPVSLFIRGVILHLNPISIAPLFFAANQAVVGYFIGTYIDRSLKNETNSQRIAMLQAATQAFVAALVLYFVEPMKQMHLQAWQESVFGAVFVLQAGISGFAVGLVFQAFYRRTKETQGEVIGDVTVEALAPAE